MIQLHTINNPHNSLAKDTFIPLESKGIVDISIRLNLNAPHELELSINPELGRIYYDLLENPFAGIRVDQSDGLSLGFIKQQLDQKSTEQPTGVAKIKFVSTVSLTNNTRKFINGVPLGTVFTGSIKSFFSTLSEAIEIDFISTDKQINYLVPIGSVYNTVTMATDDLGNYSWRDLGVTPDNKIKIEVGNGNSRPINNDLLATNLLEHMNQDLNVMTIKSVLISNSGETLTHLRPVGNRGVGGDLSSTIFITDLEKNEISVNPDYPLVPSAESTAYGRRIYDIQNIKATSDTEVSRPYVVNLTEYQIGNESTNYNQAQQIYNQSVNFLKNKNEATRSLIDFKPNKILVPGERFRACFRHRKSNGEMTIIDEIISLGSITYSAKDLINIINNYG